MVTIISHSPEETLALGQRWGQEARTPFVVALYGELGAGKTQLVKGIALGLGIQSRVHSPTFTLVNAYSGGRLPLFHLDLYRLDTPQQIASAGLEEYLAPAGIAVIEWADRWPDIERHVAGRLRRVRLETLSPTERSISHEDTGA
jgi:tRNA threonylcarbamoyladenosine biosynthesis protein TsaE